MSKPLMIWGYDREAFYQYKLPVPFCTQIDSHCHAVLTGSSGSGKSQGLLFLIGKRLQADPDCRMTICDFKNSDDFQFLKDYPHYFRGNDCYSGIMDYYQRFSKARESGKSDKWNLLICDEYPAMLNHLQMQDKLNKTRCSNEITGAVSEILMMGRGLHYGCFLVTQRCDSALFANGSRDNFMSVIALGRLSREQKGMLFSGEDLPDHIYKPGEGIILLDGRGIAEVKLPLIKNVNDWKAHIRSLLMRNGGGHADREA